MQAQQRRRPPAMAAFVRLLVQPWLIFLAIGCVVRARSVPHPIYPWLASVVGERLLNFDDGEQMSRRLFNDNEDFNLLCLRQH